MNYKRSYEFYKEFIQYDEDGLIDIDCIKYIQSRLNKLDIKYIDYWKNELKKNTTNMVDNISEYKSVDDVDKYFDSVYIYDKHLSEYGFKFSFMIMVYLMYDLEAFISHLENDYNNNEERLNEFFKTIVRPTITLYMTFNYTVSLNRLCDGVYDTLQTSDLHHMVYFDHLFDIMWYINLVHTEHIFGFNIYRIWKTNDLKYMIDNYMYIRNIKFTREWFLHFQNILQKPAISFYITEDGYLSIEESTGNEHARVAFSPTVFPIYIFNKLSKADIKLIKDLHNVNYNLINFKTIEIDYNKNKSLYYDYILTYMMLIYISYIYYKQNININKNNKTNNILKDNILQIEEYLTKALELK